MVNPFRRWISAKQEHAAARVPLEKMFRRCIDDPSERAVEVVLLSGGRRPTPQAIPPDDRAERMLVTSVKLLWAPRGPVGHVAAAGRILGHAVRILFLSALAEALVCENTPGTSFLLAMTICFFLAGWVLQNLAAAGLARRMDGFSSGRISMGTQEVVDFLSAGGVFYLLAVRPVQPDRKNPVVPRIVALASSGKRDALEFLARQVLRFGPTPVRLRLRGLRPVSGAGGCTVLEARGIDLDIPA